VLSLLGTTSDRTTSTHTNIASTGSLRNGSPIGGSIEGDVSFAVDVLSAMRTSSDKSTFFPLRNGSSIGGSIEDDVSFAADVLSVMRTSSDKSTSTHSNIASTSCFDHGSLVGSSIDDIQVQILLQTMSEEHAPDLHISPSVTSLTLVDLILNKPSESPAASAPSPIGMEINLTNDDD